MKFALLTIAASLALVACKADEADQSSSNDVHASERALASTVSLDISGMT